MANHESNENPEVNSNNNQQGSSRIRSFWKLFLANRSLQLVVFIVIVVAVLITVFMSGRSMGSRAKTTKLGFSDIGELATQVGYFTNVQVIEGDHKLWGLTIPLTRSKAIFSYDGTIKAGIDFSQIEYQVDNSSHTVTVHLPEVQVFDVTVDEDSLMVYDERVSIFTPIKIDDFSDARAQMQETVRNDAVENGLLDQAEENAKRLIQSFLATEYNPGEYQYVFD